MVDAFLVLAILALVCLWRNTHKQLLHTREIAYERYDMVLRLGAEVERLKKKEASRWN